MNYSRSSVTKFLKKDQKEFGKIKSLQDRIFFSEYLSKKYSREELTFLINDLKSSSKTWEFMASSTNSIISLFTTLAFSFVAVALAYYYSLHLELIKLGGNGTFENLLSPIFIGLICIVFVLCIFTLLVSNRVSKENYFISICEMALEKNLYIVVPEENFETDNEH